MTHETCDMLDLLEDAGLLITWAEVFSPVTRSLVYFIHGTDDEGEQWAVSGESEDEVVNALVEQLDWKVLTDYPTRLTSPQPNQTQ